MADLHTGKSYFMAHNQLNAILKIKPQEEVEVPKLYISSLFHHDKCAETSEILRHCL